MNSKEIFWWFAYIFLFYWMKCNSFFLNKIIPKSLRNGDGEKSVKKKKLPWTVYRVLKNLSLEFRNWCKFPGIPRTLILFWSEACWQVSLDYAILKFLLFQVFLCVTPEYVLCWGVAFVVFTLGMGGECDWETCPRTTYLLANN